MAVSESYREFVLEQLGRVTPVIGKSMFGGVGIYAQGLFVLLRQVCVTAFRPPR
jgi:DNA transformation protein